MSRRDLLARLRHDRYGGELSTPGGRVPSMFEALYDGAFMRGWNACSRHVEALLLDARPAHAAIVHAPTFAFDGEGG